MQMEDLYSECFELVKNMNKVQKQIFLLLEPTLGKDDAAVAMGSLIQRYTCKAQMGDQTLDKNNDIHRFSQQVGRCLILFMQKSKQLAEENIDLSFKLQEDVASFAKINDPKVYEVL
eukprot:TRINITY_DN2453_c0_g1_i1.p1 TRINITY_DN2453_c0_g1~~TRINITY_DN2453_c0_g1_i1.p1  ORF type:complete len:117 (-),score=7.99 TRINITY_DN2453_c0_g1_i1:27-377(-)